MLGARGPGGPVGPGALRGSLGSVGAEARPKISFFLNKTIISGAHLSLHVIIFSAALSALSLLFVTWVVGSDQCHSSSGTHTPAPH